MKRSVKSLPDGREGVIVLESEGQRAFVRFELPNGTFERFEWRQSKVLGNKSKRFVFVNGLESREFKEMKKA